MFATSELFHVHRRCQDNLSLENKEMFDGGALTQHPAVLKANEGRRATFWP